MIGPLGNYGNKPKWPTLVPCRNNRKEGKWLYFGNIQGDEFPGETKKKCAEAQNNLIQLQHISTQNEPGARLKKEKTKNININLFTWYIISTHLQSITGVGSPEWMLFTLIGHQYCRLYVAVANTYWIIDVFGFQSISTIAAFIKVLAWLMALWAKSYPCMPLQGLHRR